ncbi:MAG: iron ABC transporter permease [Thermomicrobiales bacterium]
MAGVPRGAGNLRWGAGWPPLWLLGNALLAGGPAVLPLAYLVARAVEDPGSVWQILWRPKTAQVLVNTLVLVGSVSAAAVSLALPLAWLTARTDLPARRVWTTLFTLPLVIPSFVGALAYVSALGPRGLAQQALASAGIDRLPSIYGFWGAWGILTLFTLPYAFLTLRAAIAGLDPAQEDAARSLGLSAWPAFRRVTLPQLRPAMAAGGLLAALYTLGDFGVVTLLRYDAFTRAIYTTYRASFDRSAAAGLSLALVVLALLVLAVETRVRGRAPLYRVGSGASRSPAAIALGRWRAPALALCLAVAVAAFALPLGVLAIWAARSWDASEVSPHLPAALQTSAGLGVGAAVIAGVLATPVALLSVRFPSRLARFVDRAAYLTYALPGIVIAIAFVAITVRTPWYQTMGVLALACATRFLAQAIGSTRVSLLQISPRLEEAARSLGASQRGAFWRVTMPLMRPGVQAGLLLVFLTTVKELPITLLLMPTGARTLPTLIWTAAGDARYGEAALPALALVAVTALPAFLLARRQPATAL